MTLVRLVGIPAADFVRLHLHVDDLMRELEIIDVGHRAGVASAPAELRDLMRRLLLHYAEAREAAWAQAEAATADGRATVDMELELPVEAADAAVKLTTLFEHADELSRAGILLTMPTPPELQELRRWTTTEVCRQLQEGATPCPYPC
ncbi:MAG TPA: hypothetical protein VM938_06855 [Acidimicrobiales bacterium]|nr:hypothetical protein [Acidimicrobiales bacterium]